MIVTILLLRRLCFDCYPSVTVLSTRKVSEYRAVLFESSLFCVIIVAAAVVIFILSIFIAY